MDKDIFFDINLIYEIADGEADKKAAEEFFAHAENCPNCRRAYEEASKLRAVMRENQPALSADFTNRTMKRIRAAKKPLAVRLWNNPAFKAATVAAACLLVVAFVFHADLFGKLDKNSAMKNIANETAEGGISSANDDGNTDTGDLSDYPGDTGTADINPANFGITVTGTDETEPEEPRDEPAVEEAVEEEAETDLDEAAPEAPETAKSSMRTEDEPESPEQEEPEAPKITENAAKPENTVIEEEYDEAVVEDEYEEEASAEEEYDEEYKSGGQNTSSGFAGTETEESAGGIYYAPSPNTIPERQFSVPDSETEAEIVETANFLAAQEMAAGKYLGIILLPYTPDEELDWQGINERYPGEFTVVNSGFYGGYFYTAMEYTVKETNLALELFYVNAMNVNVINNNFSTAYLILWQTK